MLDGVRGLAITEWSYKDTPGVRHLGPTAQDFSVAFGLGATDTGIASLDGSGVALASIQALAAENDALRVQNVALSGRVDDLEQRLVDLEALVEALTGD